MNESAFFGIFGRMDNVGSRIRRLREARNLKQNQLADVLSQHIEGGITRGAVGNWERNQGIKAENLSLIAQLLDCSLDWLMHGTGDPPESETGGPIEDIPAVSSNGLRRQLAPGSLPEFDLRAGASYGGGYALPTQIADAQGRTYSAEAVRAQWSLPIDFLRHELRVSPLTTDVLPIDGTSMMPDLLPGDRVFIDRGHRDPRQGGMFAIREGESIIIKHVELVRGSDPPRILCSSSNPTYKPFELILDGAEVEIIGRVAGRITRL